ncbi:MAG: hypothetical protein GY757_20180 [bacterium]|nr:hypothetical protein [bacterium]
MDNRFVPDSELKEYFTKKRLRDDLDKCSNMGICSVADVLFITEDYKKGNMKIDSPIDSYSDFENGPCENGQIVVAELDKDQLNEALFDTDSDYDDIKLWEEAARIDIEPKASLNLLVLKETQCTWWSAAVFRQMCDCYQLNEDENR